MVYGTAMVYGIWYMNDYGLWWISMVITHLLSGVYEWK